MIFLPIKKMVFYNLRANGATHINQKEPSLIEKKLLSYYVVDNAP
jgi:hypothetical protein